MALAMDAYRPFLTNFLATTALILLTVLGINSYIDPLWHFRGNLSTGINYAFSERDSKLNLFLRSPGQYDCIMFGSSATVIIDTDRIKGHHCFNFSFKGGGVRDFIDYAKYFKHIGFTPTLVLVSVDLYALQLKNLESYAPEYIKTLQPPPSAVESYLSWDALDFSFRTVLNVEPGPQNYDKNFKGILLPIKHKIMPRSELPPDLAKYYSTSNPVSDDNVKYYRELRDIFGPSTYIGFVPYRSTKIMLEMKAAGQLEPLLRAVYEIGKFFDRFYDFTIPAQITMEAKDSYDGFHFGVKTMAHITEEINGDTQQAFLRIDRETFGQYRDDYNRRIEEYIESEKHPLNK